MRTSRKSLVVARSWREYPEGRFQDGEREGGLVSSPFMVVGEGVPGLRSFSWPRTSGRSLTSCSTPTAVNARSMRSAAPAQRTILAAVAPDDRASASQGVGRVGVFRSGAVVGARHVEPAFTSSARLGRHIAAHLAFTQSSRRPGPWPAWSAGPSRRLPLSRFPPGSRPLRAVLPFLVSLGSVRARGLEPPDRFPCECLFTQIVNYGSLGHTWASGELVQVVRQGPSRTPGSRAGSGWRPWDPSGPRAA